MYQNEHGTWTREDMADHTPPLEKLGWLCAGCRAWIEKVSIIYSIYSGHIRAMERVDDIAGLKLISPVHCAACGLTLTEKGYREVY